MSLVRFVKWIGFHDDFVVLANIIRYVGKHLFEMLALLLFIMYFYAILGVMLFRCRYRVDPADQKVSMTSRQLQTHPQHVHTRTPVRMRVHIYWNPQSACMHICTQM